MSLKSPRNRNSRRFSFLTWVNLIGLGVGLIPGIAGPSGPTGRDQEPIVTVTTPKGVRIYAELADTMEKRARGLMFRDSLARDRGMLFSFPELKPWTFWMKNTKVPLDIIWMDQNKKIVHVETNVPGCHRMDDGCPQYQPVREALYVLEIAAGMAEALKLERGVTLQFQLPASSTASH